MTTLARATALMTIGTVLSRLTGLLRLGAIAAALGVVESRLPDAYNLANTAPNIIYELVLGGVLTSVFVPVFVELLQKEGRERAWEVGSALINLSLIILLSIATIGVIAAPWLAKVYAFRFGGSEAEAERVLTFLLRLFIPQIIFYGLAAITAGLLNAHKRFGAPMYTPILNNLAVIAIFIAFHQAYGEVGLDATDRQLWIIGGGTTAGIALMALAQLPFLRGLGRYRFTLSVAHPSVKKVARLSVYVIGYVIANQIGYLIVQVLAAGERGGYSAYVGAFTFFMLPHGLFAVSVITALLPAMSERAVHQDWDGFKDRISVGIRTTFLMVLPAAVGYFVLAEPIVRLLQRGVMTAESTEAVAAVLRFFVLGLVPFSAFQLLLRGFYALQDTKTPFLINCWAVAINVAINVPMFAWLGVEGLAAGHALSYIFGSFALGRAMARRVGGFDVRPLVQSAVRIGAASLVMGLVVHGARLVTENVIGTGSFSQGVLVVGIPVAIGALSYLFLARVFGVRELDHLRGLVTKRPQRS